MTMKNKRLLKHLGESLLFGCVGGSFNTMFIAIFAPQLEHKLLPVLYGALCSFITIFVIYFPKNKP